MTERRLYLVRHASAAERGPAYPDDSRRPLVAKGEQQARALTRALRALGLSFDQLFSSPYTRAAQSAEPLAALLKKGRHVQYLDALTTSDYAQLLTDIRERLEPRDTYLALVGHEPYLSELSSYLLTGGPGLDVHFKKAAVLVAAGRLIPGAMRLEMLVPSSFYKRVSR